jgi:hypothetical protein
MWLRLMGARELGPGEGFEVDQGGGDQDVAFLAFVIFVFAFRIVGVGGR